jgi:hypothetical protein
MWAGLWLYASIGRHRLNEQFPESRRFISTVLFVSGTAIYGVSIAIALVSPYACLAFHGALALYYAFDPISRRVAHEQVE